MSNENINLMLKNILGANSKDLSYFITDLLDIERDKVYEQRIKVGDTDFNKYYKYGKLNEDIELLFALDLYLIDMEIENNYSMSSSDECRYNINRIIRNSYNIENEDNLKIYKDVIYKALDRKLIDISITDEMVDHILDDSQYKNLTF